MKEREREKTVFDKSAHYKSQQSHNTNVMNRWANVQYAIIFNENKSIN